MDKEWRIKTEIIRRQKEANESTSFTFHLPEVEMKTRTGRNWTTLSGFEDDVLCVLL